MPIEIRELLIRATVIEATDSQLTVPNTSKSNFRQIEDHQVNENFDKDTLRDLILEELNALLPSYFEQLLPDYANELLPLQKLADQVAQILRSMRER